MANRNTRKNRNTRGFTLAEVLIAVAVMAILITVTSPALISFLRQRDVRQEQLAQLSIRNAMVAMLNEKNTLPSDADTGSSAWYNTLARYTDLSPAQLQNDIWKNPRTYVMLQSAQNINGNTVSVTYVTVLSRGPNGKASSLTNSSGVTIIPVSGNDYAAPTNTGWWKLNSTDPIAAFSAVGTPTTTDDIILRYTNYPARLNAYNDTQTRMVRISQALENYARARYAERVATCSVTTPPADCATYPPEKQVHYPPATNGPTNTFVPDSSFYNQAVLASVNAQNGGSPWYFYNGTDNASRRTALIGMMRLLGLPDEYCCSGVDTYTDAGGNLVSMPFYYFSNPRARNANGTTCGARPGVNDPKLPARLTTGYTPDGTSGATCG
ncbi:MAG TPA: type II secretion system protein [Alphaproteobacteria bacterium]|nr:type II secretion system protein [Alphaproteobacteria bacterium]